MREGNSFSLSTLGGGVPHLRSGRGGGYFIPGPDNGEYLITGLDGGGGGFYSADGDIPLSKIGWGIPPPISKASTCYAAGSVPLAFTQEDFLVEE